MLQILTILFIQLFVSCAHRYETSKELADEFQKRSNQKYDTLIVDHDECTECLDLHILQGTLTIPKDIIISSNLPCCANEIKVCGNFPIDLIDMTTFNFDPNLTFKIVGEVIKADTANGLGSVPLFYVSSWQKFRFDE